VRKLVRLPIAAKPEPRRTIAKLVNRDGATVFPIPKGYKLDPEAIGRAVAEEREGRA